jgi:hypothetical protein
VWLELDNLPEYLYGASKEAVVSPPAIFNGVIDRPGLIQEWKVRGEKGRAVRFELRAQDLGSSLQGVLEVVDQAGKSLGKATVAGNQDPVVLAQPTSDGVLTVRVKDRFRSRGRAWPIGCASRTRNLTISSP